VHEARNSIPQKGSDRSPTGVARHQESNESDLLIPIIIVPPLGDVIAEPFKYL